MDHILFYAAGEWFQLPAPMVEAATSALYRDRCRIAGERIEEHGETSLDRSLTYAALLGSGLLEPYRCGDPSTGGER